MLLRSSSTPIFGSLLAASSCSESPGHGGNPLERAHSDAHSKLSIQTSSFHGFSLQATHSPSHAQSKPGSAGTGFRRARSEGNLKELEERPAPPSRRGPVLETIPSFSFPSSPGSEEGADIAGGDDVAVGRGVAVGAPLFLAKGIGIEGFGGAASEVILGIGGGTGGIGGGGGGLGNGSGNQADMEAYYKRMVEEDPGNALLLTNYAQFLHQSKRDLKRAEEFYSRAVLAEPGDGEVLSQYAKVIWELHQDRGRATGYFEQAVQAAPQNSHVLASYASFLWEAEDEDEDEDEEEVDEMYAGSHIHLMASPPTLSC